MRESFLPYLADPETGESLELVVVRREGDRILEGSLRSSFGEYPIVRGVPRFAGYVGAGDYVASFGYQWNRWRRVQFDSANRGRSMDGYTRRMWERITGRQDRLDGLMLADFGCGPGRFLETVREKGARVIGIDLSSAVEAAQDNFGDDPDVLICQADALKPPLRAASFDAAYSIGVLHHTPKPSDGVSAMARSLKPEGWLGVCVYQKGSYYDSPLVRLYRKIFNAVEPILGHYPPLLYSYFAAYVLNPLSRLPLIGLIVKATFPFARIPDSRWSLLDTFDSVTPSHQSTHESYEVFRWLKDLGMTGIEPSDWGATSYHAIKPLACEPLTK